MDLGYHEPMSALRRLEDRLCPTCGVLFRPRNANSIYCGHGCYAATLKGVPQPRPYRPSRVHQMSDVEAAWLAGFFDGEGSIIWADQSQRHIAKTLRVSIGNTYRPVLERCREITGVSSVIDAPQAMRKNPKHSMAWIWYAYSANAADVLRQMLPYLVVKREKAELALARFAELSDMTD